MRLHYFLIGLVTLAALSLATPSAVAETAHVWPVVGPIVRGFDPPSTVYGAGHRGIDIASPAGTTVVASADGVVTFEGVINYVPMLTITHPDGVRTTYQPVAATVKQGETVTAGQAIGHLLAGHGAEPSLHFGVLVGRTYLDPLRWLGVNNAEIRLLPDGTALPQRSGAWPVTGTVTSPYGWRIHPILKTRLFHNGIDIASPCGTPVITPWAGVVTAVGTSSSAGLNVHVLHDGGLATAYLHLSATTVAVGDQLPAGAQIGRVGTTGMSTGCHLHFSASQNGQSIDPATLLSG